MTDAKTYEALNLELTSLRAKVAQLENSQMESGRLAQARQRSTELQFALAEVEAQNLELKKLARQERALTRTIERVRQSPYPETIFKVTAEEVRQILNCDRVVVYRFYADFSGFVYESVAPGWKPLIPSESIKEKDIWQNIYLPESQDGGYANHQTWAIDDRSKADLSPSHLELLQQMEAKAFVVVPVFAGEKLWGLLGAYENSQPRHWEEREITLLAQVGNQLGVELNQAELLARSTWQSCELKATVADLNAIVDNLADGLLVTDRTGKITRFNPALLQMFNLQTIDLKGKHLIEYFPLELLELVEKTEGQKQKKEIFTAEVELENNRVGQALATSIFEFENESVEFGNHEAIPPIASVILIRDVTVAREVDRMKTDFLATVSHELRTPLTSILGFASIIQETLFEKIVPAVPEENRKAQKAVTRVVQNIDIIISESERLTSLLNDVLDIGKMEAGRIHWNLEPTEPSEILERAIIATSPLFTNKGLKLLSEIAPGLPEIHVDRHRMIQVVINLISNGVKFTERGTITSWTKREGNEVVFGVSDTGIGIAAEDQEKVFDRFAQVGDVLTSKPKGTGLGLPICKHIVEHHGGRIWLESKLGKGSTFRFTIPIQQPPVQKVTGDIMS